MSGFAFALNAALEVFREIVIAQGGDVRMVDDPSRLPTAPHQITVKATAAGHVHRVDARKVAMTALGLGAGRHRAGDPIDPRVGITQLVKIGDRIEPGMTLAKVHAASAVSAAIASADISAAVTVGAGFSHQGFSLIERVI